MKPALVLMLIGAIMLATVVSAGVAYEVDKGRVAEFFEKTGNAAPLPNMLNPEPIQPMEVIGFIAGGIMVAVGFRRSDPRAIRPAIDVRVERG